jgi:hypothetical protein
MRIRAIHSDTPTYYMEGTANYVGGGTLIITVDKFNGSGSHNSWNFAVSGELGQTGTSGASGVISVNSPITNSGTSGSAILGLDQTALSITRSQITDFTSGTVTNISGTVTQAQVSGLTTSLAGKASLGAANTFTVGGHIINSEGASVKPLVIRGNSGQISNLQEWQSTASGTVTVASINDSGYLSIQVLSTSSANIGGGASNGVLSVMPSVSGVGISVRAQSGQTGNLQEWNNSSGAILSRINSSGNLIVSTGTATAVPLTVVGVASQSANLFEVQTSSATAVRINQVGNTTFVGNITSQNNALFTPNSTATVPLTVRGAASQSANLQEWQNSGGTAIARVDSSGNIRSTVSFFGNTLETNSGLASMRESNSVGTLQLTRGTAAVTNPGANIGRIYFRDGTTAGTLKLVVRAGAAGAETTILDNIPQ